MKQGDVADVVSLYQPSVRPSGSGRQDGRLTSEKRVSMNQWQKVIIMAPFDSIRCMNGLYSLFHFGGDYS